MGFLALIVALAGMIIPDEVYLLSLAVSLAGSYLVLKATMKVAREKTEFKIHEVFKLWNTEQFVTYVFTSLLSFLFLVGWMFVPFMGIIKSFSYMLAPYLALDYPDWKPNDLITKSRKMMDGYKMQAFFLGWSFFLWILGVIVTFGLLSIYVLPYMYLATAFFYIKLKEIPDEQSC